MRSPGFEKKREEETKDDTAELATKKGRQVFQEKNRGVTPSVAAPGVTHPSDATARTQASETFVVDESVAVDVRLANHLFDLVVGQLLAERHHYLTKLAGRDVAVAVLVEHLERLAQLDLLVLRRLHLPQHHRHELVEVDRSVACIIIIIITIIIINLELSAR